MAATGGDTGAGDLWTNFQRRGTEQFGEEQQRVWASVLDFWKHLVLVEATILGFTVGLLVTQQRGAPIELVVTWVTLLVGILIGCVLIRGGITLQQARSLASFRMQHDIAELQLRVAARTLQVGSDEHQGLLIAAMMQVVPTWQVPRAFTPEQRARADRWRDRLPSANLVNTRPPSAFFVWYEHYSGAVETAFYAISIGAFAVMVVSVVASGRATIGQMPPKLAHSAPAAQGEPDSTHAIVEKAARAATPQAATRKKGGR